MQAITKEIDRWSEYRARWSLDSLDYRMYPLPNIAEDLAAVLDQ